MRLTEISCTGRQWVLPAIIERLRGTPARVEEMTGGLSPELLIGKRMKSGRSRKRWGIFPNLEPLWLGRLEDLINGLPELRVTDLTNQKTHTANHNAVEITLLLRRFRTLRGSW